jgi:hypothetical protein
MLITNKEDLLDKLKLVVGKDCIYIQVLDYTLFVYSYSDYYYLRSSSEQSTLHPIGSILKLDITSEDIKILKKYLSLKSSRIEIKDNCIYLAKYKQTKKDLVPILVEGSEVIINLEVVDRLPNYVSHELPISKATSFINNSHLPAKIDTKFEFDAIELVQGVYVNSNLLPTINKIFEGDVIAVGYNLEDNTCSLVGGLDTNVLYVKCLDKVS